jgi:hypothetical protein
MMSEPNRPRIRRRPAPELGEHLHGPRILAASSRAAIALKAIYGYSWGLEVDIRAVRCSFEKISPTDDPIENLQLGLAASKQELTLDGLPPQPQNANLTWAVRSGSGTGEPGFEWTSEIGLVVLPYPTTGLWLGWSWPQLELSEDSATFQLPKAIALQPLV